jgi:hypothetical protein
LIIILRLAAIPPRHIIGIVTWSGGATATVAIAAIRPRRRGFSVRRFKLI